MRVLVCGGRDYHDRSAVERALWKLDAELWPIRVVLHGGASGADAEGMLWAVGAGRAALAFPADWTKHGKAAGPIRNQQMLDEGVPDLVLAFPGGRGTADMVRRAKRAGVNVQHAR